MLLVWVCALRIIHEQNQRDSEGKGAIFVCVCGKGHIKIFWIC